MIENNKNYVEINNIALESERHMISNRAAAAISNAALIVFGIITYSESDHIVDHKKVWRARQKKGGSLNTQPVENRIEAQFFYGKKNLTLTKEMVDGKYYSSNVVEDHYVLLGEPNGIYLTHFVVEKGTGSNIVRKNG